MLIDVHTHLDYKGFHEPVAKIVGEASKAGVVAIVNCGLNPESNRATKRLAQRFYIVKPAYGFYPIDAESATPKQIDAEIDWIRKQEPIAISEVGMDGKHGKDFKKQSSVFKRFIKLAIQMDIPLIVHTRDREKGCIEILEKMHAQKVVLHCFTGHDELVRRAVKNKYFFSIPPIIIYNSGFQRLVNMVGLNQILTETDSPFLAPKPGHVNVPKNVGLTVEKIAEIKGLDQEEVKRMIYLNFQRLFL